MMWFLVQAILASQVFKTELISIKQSVLYTIDMYMHTQLSRERASSLLTFAFAEFKLAARKLSILSFKLWGKKILLLFIFFSFHLGLSLSCFYNSIVTVSQRWQFIFHKKQGVLCFIYMYHSSGQNYTQLDWIPLKHLMEYNSYIKQLL